MKNGDYIMVIAPSDFPGKKYRNRYCYEHILVYWQAYGVLPDASQIIHHKDGNKHNNSITNLELRSRGDHTKLHNIKQGHKVLKLICPGCQKEFIRRKHNSYLEKGGEVSCCSRRCIGIYTALSPQEKLKRKNNMFIEEYTEYMGS